MEVLEIWKMVTDVIEDCRKQNFDLIDMFCLGIKLSKEKKITQPQFIAERMKNSSKADEMAEKIFFGLSQKNLSKREILLFVWFFNRIVFITNGENIAKMLTEEK